MPTIIPIFHVCILKSLALQRQVMRQAQFHKQEIRGQLQEILEDLQEERDTKQAIYSGKHSSVLYSVIKE